VRVAWASVDAARGGAVGCCVTFLIVYALGEALHRVASSEPSRDARVGAAVKLTLIGGAASVAAGFFTMMTHLCP